MTKCLKLSCDKEAKPGFECCSALHGADVRFYRAQILQAFDADNERHLFSARVNYSVEEALAYA